MLFKKQEVNPNQSVKALLAFLSSDEPNYAIRKGSIIQVIKFLQENTSVNQNDLFKVEWAYIDLLDEKLYGVKPKCLESKLANEPEFFCEVIRSIYRSKHEKQPKEKTTEETKAIAKNALRLLQNWKVVPGTQSNNTFKEDCFKQWIQKVKELCTESGHLELALYHIGSVLIYAPADSNGLWIHQSIAATLDEYDANKMRSGYNIGVFNSRGIHLVDSTGKTEQKLAAQWREKAETVENAGFNRFATTLREISKKYDNYYKTYALF